MIKDILKEMENPSPVLWEPLGGKDEYLRPATPLYTYREVNTHCEAGDCWVVVHNIVYDITPFMQQRKHPGGHEILLENAGLDITNVFRDKGHSAAAWKMLEKYQIGALVPKDRVYF